MSFVQRQNGTIVGAFACMQPGFAEEELPDDDPELITFRGTQGINMNGTTADAVNPERKPYD